MSSMRDGPLSKGVGYSVPEDLPFFDGTDRKMYGLVSIKSFCKRCGATHYIPSIEPWHLKQFLGGDISNEDLEVDLSMDDAILHLLKICTSCLSEDEYKKLIVE